MNLLKIGEFECKNSEYAIKVFPEYTDAMTGLEQFNCLQIIWWFDKTDNAHERNQHVERQPYKQGPALLGSFATRTPSRPNPIALSTVFVFDIDIKAGIIMLPYADALTGSPVLDIKPYIPSIDRVENPMMPN